MLRRRPASRRLRVAIWVAGVLTLGLVSAGGYSLRPVSISLLVEGVPDRPINAAALPGLAFRVEVWGSDPGEVRLRFDGRTVTGQVSQGVVIYRPEHLDDGAHQFVAEVRHGRLFGLLSNTTQVRRTLTVDTTPPSLEVREPASAASFRDPVTVTGRARDASTLTVDTRPVALADDGTFRLTFPRPPAAAHLIAADAAGNQTRRTLSVPVKLPRTRGVHVTAYGWAYLPLRQGILDLVRSGRINTVELDIKDEDGIVANASKVPLANRTGAAKGIYDARAALDLLHGMKVRVVGRIVAFRDPTLARWAWRHGHRDWVVQNASGRPYASSYGSIAFTNFAHPAIRRYNIDLAVEAARLGFDGIIYDYVRRPDGSLSRMRFPHIRVDAQVSVAQFLHQSRDPVHEAGAHIGAAVFGIAATRPHEIAQSIPLMARYVDYVAPMVYPSHWNRGEYGVAHPNAQPYDIVARSLADFVEQTKGTHARVVPWLQDFSLGVRYGAPQVRAQITAAADNGLHDFFLWNAGVRYHGAALPPLR